MSSRAPYNPWTTPELNKMVQRKLTGVSHTQLAKELGRSRNSVACAFNNHIHDKVWDWSSIKKIAKGE